MSADQAIEALVHSSHLVQAALDRSAREHGVSATLARLLDLLGDRSPTVNELAVLLGLDKSSTSGLIDRAQARGLVRRVRSQLDRRSVRVRLTTDGRELQQQLRAGFEREMTAWLGHLAPTDRAALAGSLGQLLAARGA